MVNSHLADGFGNLLSRTIALATKKDISLTDDIAVCNPDIRQIIEEKAALVT